MKIEQENDELIETIEEETLEEYEEVLSEKVVTLDNKGRAIVDSDDDFNEATNEDYLEDTEEFQPPKQQHDDEVVIKRKFTTKPPVVTEPKRRGRPKRPPQPKFQNVNPEHVYV